MQERIENKVLAEIHKEDMKLINELREELSVYKELVFKYQKIINLNNIDKISKEIGDLKGQLIFKNKSKLRELGELMRDENC